MANFSALNRPAIVQQLNSEKYDLVIIGGGITGCGIALDAASRGLKCALIEKKDFASGTSSKSTKLIHGGLRYLKQFEIGLVREVGRERATVHKLAPHLVVSEKMLIPIVEGGTFGKLLTSVGLMVYDVLAGVKRSDQRKMLNKAETLKAEPLLPGNTLKGGGLYAEYRTDDARLTMEIIKTAVQKGATAINYVQAEEFIYENGLVKGVKGTDRINGESLEIAAEYVVSAAGPWVDDLRKINRSLEGKHLFLSKGVHIVVPHHLFPVQQSVYFDVPDGRMIFAIPRGRITYIGTTDTHYTGDKDRILTDKEDVAYIIDGIHHTFPDLNLQMEDVISSWAGLRPLIFEEGKSASEISRKDEIFQSDSGLISIAGGKLTGYRKMAQKVVDLIAEKMKDGHNRTLNKCRTHQIILSGGPFENGDAVQRYCEKVKNKVEAYGFDPYAAQYLVHNYGRQTDLILDHLAEKDDDDIRLKLAKAELEFCIHHELTQTPMDFFNRRTGRLYFDIETIPFLIEPILREFQRYFNWSDEKVEAERQNIHQAIEDVSVFK